MLDKILNTYNTDAKLEIFRKTELIDLNIEECLSNQIDEYSAKCVDLLLRRPMIYQYISENSTYQDYLLKIYISAVYKYFKLPDDYIKLDVDDKQNDEIESGGEEQKTSISFNKELSNYIEHYIIKNVFVNGGAFVETFNILKTIKTDLNLLDHNMYNTIVDFLNLSIYQMYFVQPNVSMSVIGNEQIKIEDESVNIKITGINFAVKMVEITKSILDMMNEKSFPTELDISEQAYLRQYCNNYYLEFWMWRFGVDYYNKFVVENYRNDMDYHLYLIDMFSKKYSELLTFMME